MKVSTNTKFLCQASWTDVPHLDDKTKAQLLASIPDFQRDARTKGIPSLGAGQIFKVAAEDVTVADFVIPKHWPRCYGMDFGWNWTAVIWAAWNRETDTVYLWSCYKRGEAEPSVHADAIRARGTWIPGVCDPAGKGSSVIDGRKVLDVYKKLGIDLALAENAVESGIYEVWQRLATGRLKVFSSLQEWFYEYGRYQRDDKGKVKKVDDHLMDATRYCIVTGLKRATVEPVERVETYEYSVPAGGLNGSLGWLGG